MIQRMILIAAAFFALQRSSIASPAQEGALELLNQRNIFFGEVEFIEAVERGNAEIVRIFIQAGMNPSTKLERHLNPLHIAALRGYDRTAAFLLDGGAWVDLPDKQGYTPLMLGSTLGYEKVVNVLLQNGADPNLQNKLGTTALILAVQGRHAGVVRMLLEADADALVSLEGGVNAITLAIKLNEKNILDLLSAHGHATLISTEQKRIVKARQDEESTRIKREAKHQRKIQKLQDAALGNGEKRAAQ